MANIINSVFHLPCHEQQGDRPSVSRRRFQNDRTIIMTLLIVLLLLTGAAARLSSEKNHHDDEAAHRLRRQLLPFEKETGMHTAVAAGANNPIPVLQQKFKRAKQELFNMLERDYGKQVFETMWMTDIAFNQTGVRTSRGRTAFLSPANPGGKDRTDVIGPSWSRMVRKLQIKLLQAIVQKESPVNFVWATGGHSAAASHGNLFNQSYTAYMDRAARGLFEALNLNLVARNYAIGSQNSAPQVALCAQSLFGVDYDVLSWDYGMTDAREMAEQDLYMYRGAMSAKQRPAMVLFGWNPMRIEAAKELEDRGLTTLYLDGFNEVANKMEPLIPDTFGKNTQGIHAMPPFVRSYKCQGKIEKGEPTCDEEKFDHSLCAKRKFQTSWHPGWKAQAFRGNLMALLLLEVMQDALEELHTAFKQQEKANPRALLQQLQAKEAADYQKFWESDLPPRVYKEWSVIPGFSEQQHRAWIDKLYRQPVICHTALLPAEIRYKGILTGTPVPDLRLLETELVVNDDENGTLTPQEIQDNFPTPEELDWELNNSMVSQIRSDRLTLLEPNSDPEQEPRLVAEMKERQPCFVLANIDHRDYFYMSEKDGDKRFRLPNHAEKREYAPAGENAKPSGIVLFCFSMFPQPGQLHGGRGMKDGTWSILINGMQVSTLAHVNLTSNHNSDCYVAQRHDGAFAFAPDMQGQMPIKIRVKEKGAEVRFSSVVVMMNGDAQHW